MKISHQDLPATTEDQCAQDSSPTPRSPSSRIVGFTNNLLATSVVIVVALAVGNQLISLWGRPDASSTESPHMTSAWPAIENCAIEFGNRPFSMTSQRIEGDAEHAVQFLSKNCQEILRSAPEPVGPVGEAETRMISDANSLTPLATDEGKWRLFQVKNPQGDSLPMVIGLRDDCESQGSSGTTRLVTWGLAMAAGETEWTALVCQTSPTSSPQQQNELDLLIPNGARRTLGINGNNGGKLIGFTGSQAESVKRFYQQLAERKNWTLMDWKQTSSGWQGKLLPINSDKISEVQIQLSVDSNLELRGLLVVEPKL